MHIAYNIHTYNNHRYLAQTLTKYAKKTSNIEIISTLN
jgi:hypothetical protein